MFPCWWIGSQSSIESIGESPTRLWYFSSISYYTDQRASQKSFKLIKSSYRNWVPFNTSMKRGEELVILVGIFGFFTILVI